MSQPPEPPQGSGPGYGQQSGFQYGQQSGFQYGQGPGQAPGFGYGSPYTPPPPAPTNGKAVASLITGLASLVLFWACGLGLAGIVAVVLGMKARKDIKASGGLQEGDGLAIGGIATGALAAVLAALTLAVLILALVAGADFHFSNDGGSTGDSSGTAF